MQEIRYEVDIWKFEWILYDDVLGVHVGMRKRIESLSAAGKQPKELKSSQKQTELSPPTVRSKSQNSKGRHSRDQVRSRGQSEKKPAPKPAVSAAFKELAQPKYREEDA